MLTSKQWWYAAGIRALKTFAQTIIGTGVVVGAVSAGVTSGLFQLVKKYLPESNGLRRLGAYVVSCIIALAGSYLAGDVWGVIGSWSDGTLTAATLFAYATGIWGAAEALYRLWYKPTDTPNRE